MLEPLVIALREGIEAALVIGIVLAYLHKTGRTELRRFVWVGLGLGLLASALGAAIVQALYAGRESREQQLLSGAIMILASALVLTMVVWMWRTGRKLRAEIESQVQVAVARGEGAAIPILILVFTSVFREGIETVLFLTATFLAPGSGGAGGAIGALLGLTLAALFGYLLFRGSIVIDLRRFFGLTGLLLLMFVGELLANAIHELQEALVLPPAGYGPLWDFLVWLASPDSAFYTLIAMIALPLVLIALALRSPGAERERRLARRLAFTTALLAVFILAAGTQVYAQAPRLEPVTAELTAQPELHIPADALGNGEVHRYIVPVGGVNVRFLLVRLQVSDGHWQVKGGFDSCQVCGPFGFVQKGDAVACKRCGIETPLDEIGETGGCRPFPLRFQASETEVVVKLADLAPGLARFDER
ncbi:MAG: DUF2318 domain-containing protein [Chloroflexota bacterium]|nr:DUF2318 domain-containing protein [Chloroflexota bacterium]